MARKDFYIPQIEDNEEEKQVEKKETVAQKKKPQYSSEGFVSSIYGRTVKDNAYFHGVKYGNGGRQYDSFREKENRMNNQDFKDYIIQKPDYEKPDNANNDFHEQNNNAFNDLRNEELQNVRNQDVENAPIYRQRYEDTNIPNYENEYVREDLIEEEYVNIPKRSAERPNNEYPRKDTTFAYRQPQSNNPPTPLSSTDVKKSISSTPTVRKKHKYVAPPLSLLRRKSPSLKDDMSGVQRQRNIIDQTLKEFDIAGHVVNFTKGPTVTQFEVQLDPGVRFNKISMIQSNLQGNLEATSLRMQIPIPGKATIGIEVPNAIHDTVYFGDMLANEAFLNDKNPMNVVLGMNISGKPVYLDLAKMPHGLVAGSTGSGKSVCVNAIISTILYKAHPDDVKLVLIDPKRVEFARFGGIPHLATPIITETKLATAALRWAVEEMENRYRLFEATGVSKYTEYIECEETDHRLKHIPYIVIIIDELADLMVTAGAEVEESIMRITQKARAAGIHLIVATQRPSVNIISGTIKTNITTKIAFKVNKAIDSSIILDHTGAEKLLGMGDMLYSDEMGVENRIQGAFISSSEIKDVVNAIADYSDGEYLFTEEDLKKRTLSENNNDAMNDELFYDIARYVVENQTASINSLQRIFGCGFSRIQNIIIKLGELGVVSENLGSRAREVLVNSTELEEILKNY